MTLESLFSLAKHLCLFPLIAQPQPPSSFVSPSNILSDYFRLAVLSDNIKDCVRVCVYGEGGGINADSFWNSAAL